MYVESEVGLESRYLHLSGEKQRSFLTRGHNTQGSQGYQGLVVTRSQVGTGGKEALELVRLRHLVPQPLGPYFLTAGPLISLAGDSLIPFFASPDGG